VKKIPYATQWIDAQDIEAVKLALESSYLTQGPLIEKFEKIVAEHCGAKYVVAVNSGTSALHIACLAAGIKRGDEVITSPITFVASANCILYCGAKPIFADVLEDTININPKEIEKKISKKTKAIIPIDFAGQPADLSEIRSIANRKNIIIIEDAAHALGAKYKGEIVGSGKYADFTILSFHAVKHITTGEGGMVLTNNKDFYKKLKLFRSHGIIRDPNLLKINPEPWFYEMQALGFNYRLTDIQSALGISQFKRLSVFIKRRKQITNEYDKVFCRYEELQPLSIKPYIDHVHHLYILKFNLDKLSATRREIFNEYLKYGICVNVHYIPVYYQPYYKKIGYKKGLCLNAEKYYECSITLPLYPKMSDCDIKRVVKVTKKIVEKFKIREIF